MATKDQFKEKMETQFKEWQAEIDRLMAQSERAKAELRDEYRQQIEKLRDLQDDAWDQYEKVQDATEETWEAVRQNAEKQWHDFEDQLKSFAEKFKI